MRRFASYPPIKKPYRHGPEEAQMITFFDYCRANAFRHLVFELAYHIPNERKASIARRMTLKRSGVRKGMPDICVPVSIGPYGALYIEMKVKPNKPSPEQIQIIDRLNEAGNYAVLCWSATEAIAVLEDYLANKCALNP